MMKIKIYKKVVIFFFIRISFGSIKSNSNNLDYIRLEAESIKTNVIVDELSFSTVYINDDMKTINIKPIFGLRASQVGFELDTLNINNTLTWISPGLSIQFYKPFINPISPFIIYGWSNFYKHSIYGVSGFSNNYFEYNSEYYIGYSSKSQWNNDMLKNGIDFDENIYGL